MAGSRWPEVNNNKKAPTKRKKTKNNAKNSKKRQVSSESSRKVEETETKLKGNSFPFLITIKKKKKSGNKKILDLIEAEVNESKQEDFGLRRMNRSWGKNLEKLMTEKNDPISR